MGNRIRRIANVRVMKVLQSWSAWQKELVKYEEIDENQSGEDEQVISTQGWSEKPTHVSKDHALHGIQGSSKLSAYSTCA